MAITINGVVCEELVDQFSESVDLLEGFSAVKGFLCDWNSRYLVANGLLGLTTAVSIGGLITLYYPALYPQQPNVPGVYAHRIRIEPRGSPVGSTPQLIWPKAAIWVEYGRLPFFANSLQQIDPTNPLPYAEQRISVSVEYVTIPRQFTKFKTSGLPTGQNAGVRLGLAEMEIRFPSLPYMPSPVAIANAGLINNAPFLGVGTGKLMFNGVTTQTSANYDGSYTQEGTYSFTARTQRWDYAFDGTSGVWDQVVGTSSGTPFISSGDFTTILPNYVVS